MPELSAKTQVRPAAIVNVLTLIALAPADPPHPIRPVPPHDLWPVSAPGCVIAWTAPAHRALARLPEKVATAVVEFLYGSLAASPHRAGKPLRLGLEGLHSARRGDYRVIYRIDDQRRRIDVVAIEHRSDIYRPRQL